MKKLIAAVIALFAVLTFSGCTTSTPQETTPTITITDAWVRASEYSAEAGGMTGIFGKFTNNSDKTVIITGGETDMAMMVQTHEVVNGMMQEKKGGIEIAPGETVTLEPGGLHIMIMNIKKPIVAGDKLGFTFKFDGADSQTLELTAKVSEGGDEEYNE